MEAINDSLKNIVLIKELLKEYLKDRNDGSLFLKAFELLDNTEEILANTCSGAK